MVRYFFLIVAFFIGYGFIGQGVVYSTTSVTVDTLKKDTIAIEEIIINQNTLSPLESFEKKKEDHKSIYFWGDTKDMVTLPHQGGIAVNLNKLYNKFSRNGRASRRLQKVFEREYEDDLINEIWNPLVHEYTTLKDDSLRNFTLYYKPSLRFLSESTHYEQVDYLMKSLQNYLDSAEVIQKRLKLTAE